MRKNSLWKRTVAIALAGMLALGNLSATEVAYAQSGREAGQEDNADKPQDIIYAEGKVVDGSTAWNSQGGGEINIYDGYYTNVYFENEPFIKTQDNWSNFIIETNAPAGTKGYTLRADNYGWVYGEGSEPTMSSACSEWNLDWAKFKKFCVGAVIISAYKYDANNLKFYIQYSAGDTLTYTINYPDGIPEGLKFFVGADGGKVTQNKITFTESMPNAIGAITLDKQTAGIENEYIYASQEDLDNDNFAAIIKGSVNIAVDKLEAAAGENVYFKNVKWQISDQDKAKIKENEDGSVTVSVTDKANIGDKIVVTASAADGSKAQAECEIIVYKMRRREQIKVAAINVEDQTLFLRYSDAGTPVWDSATIAPFITPDDAEIKQVVYTTDSDVVAIDGNTITGVKAGEATVTATSSSSSRASCDFKVTVKEPKMGELTSDFTAEGFRTAGSGFEKVTGDFCITYHFTNKTKGTKNYENFIFELTDGNDKFTTLRADAYGWGNLHDGDNQLSWSGAPSDWASFPEDMKDADVTVTASRSGKEIEVKYHIAAKSEKVYDMAVKCTSAAGFPETLFARITGEKVEVSNITLVNELFDISATEDAAYVYKPENVFKNVKPGAAVTFGVTPAAGYSVKKVSYGDTVLEADENGNYTIPSVTDKSIGVSVETEIVKYPITYVVDGEAQSEKGEFSVTDVVDGKVALKAAGEINGWYAAEDDRTIKITDFTAADYMTEDGITVYGYMPYQITLNPADTSSFTKGEIEAFDTSKSYYMGEEVSITTVPEEGYTANITVSYQDADGEAKNVETTKESQGGKEIVSFTMPAANVTITCAEFTTVDKFKLEEAITAAKAIYDGANSEGVYTAESYGVFKEAYEEALAARNAATQAAVDTAKENLLQAQADLVFTYKITLDKQTMTVEIGKTGKLTATVTTGAEDKSVTWSSSDEAVATVADGTVTAVAEGNATITAAVKDGTKAECAVTVKKAGTGGNESGGNGNGGNDGNGGNGGGTTEPKPTLKLSTTNVVLYTGKASNSISIKAEVTGASKAVKWVSKNPKVAKIVGDKIVAVKAGKTTVTATANNITQEVKVTVKNPSFTLKQGKNKFTKSKLTVKKSKKVTLTVAVKPSKSGISLSKLSKKQKAIASVTLKKGKLTIKGKKKGKLTVVLKSGKATKKIKVTVK